MGYMHIENLYKNQTILMFKECFAMEKIHGTSAHISYNKTWQDGSPDREEVTFFSGGANHESFTKLFDKEALLKGFATMDQVQVTVYGEAYGGKMQGMKDTYGPDLRFLVFEVRCGDTWLSVPDAEDVAKRLGLEFVPYSRIPATVEAIDAERDRPSRIAGKLWHKLDKKAEGVVLKPLIEVTLNNGGRVIAKHKRAEFSERESKRDTTVDPAKAEVLAAADKIAQEWVTSMRLEHVLDKLQADQGGKEVQIEQMGLILKAMVEDVYREAGSEIVQSPEANKAISKAASKLFMAKLRKNLEALSG